MLAGDPITLGIARVAHCNFTLRYNDVTQPALSGGPPVPARRREAARNVETLTTFNARLPKRVKNTIERAADLRGQSLSDFVLGSTYDRAIETISAEDVIRLSARDSKAFACAMIEPARAKAPVIAKFLAAHRRSQK